MAVVRTRLRQIRVSARRFVGRAEIHHVQGSGDCHRCIRVRAWGAGKTGRALQADLLSLFWPAPIGAGATDGVYPALADIRAVINYALERGWLSRLIGLGSGVVAVSCGESRLSETASVIVSR